MKKILLCLMVFIILFNMVFAQNSGFEEIIDADQLENENEVSEDELELITDLSILNEKQTTYIIKNYPESISDEQWKSLSIEQVDKNLENIPDLRKIISNEGYIKNIKIKNAIGTRIQKHFRNADDYYFEYNLNFDFQGECRYEDGKLITQKTEFDLSKLGELNEGIIKGDFNNVINVNVRKDGTIIIQTGIKTEYFEDDYLAGMTEYDSSFPILPEGVFIESILSEQYDTHTLIIEDTPYNEVYCRNCLVSTNHNSPIIHQVISAMPDEEGSLFVNGWGYFSLGEETQIHIFETKQDADKAISKIGDVPYIIKSKDQITMASSESKTIQFNSNYWDHRGVNFKSIMSDGDGAHIKQSTNVNIDGKNYEYKPVYENFNVFGSNSELGETTIYNGMGILEIKKIEQDGVYYQVPTFKTRFITQQNLRASIPFVFDFQDDTEIWMGYHSESAFVKDNHKHVAFDEQLVPITDLMDDYTFDDEGDLIVVLGKSINDEKNFLDKWSPVFSEHGSKLKISNNIIDVNVLRYLDYTLQKHPYLIDSINYNIDTSDRLGYDSSTNTLYLGNEMFAPGSVIFEHDFVNADRVNYPSSLIIHEYDHAQTHLVYEEEEKIKDDIPKGERYHEKLNQIVEDGLENLRNNPETFNNKLKIFLKSRGIEEYEIDKAINLLIDSNYDAKTIKSIVYGGWDVVENDGLSDQEKEIVELMFKIRKQENTYEKDYLVYEKNKALGIHDPYFEYDGIFPLDPKDPLYESQLKKYKDLVNEFQGTTGIPSIYGLTYKIDYKDPTNPNDNIEYYSEFAQTIKERGFKNNYNDLVLGTSAQRTRFFDFIQNEFDAGKISFNEYSAYMKNQDSSFEEVFEGGYQTLSDIEAIEDSTKRERIKNIFYQSKCQEYTAACCKKYPEACRNRVGDLERVE